MRREINKQKKLEELKKRLKVLEEKKLPEALKKFGEPYKEGAEWEVDPAFGIKDDQVAVISAMIDDLRKEIRVLEDELKRRKDVRKRR
jgi:hypothetical protein